MTMRVSIFRTNRDQLRNSIRILVCNITRPCQLLLSLTLLLQGQPVAIVARDFTDATAKNDAHVRIADLLPQGVAAHA